MEDKIHPHSEKENNLQHKFPPDSTGVSSSGPEESGIITSPEGFSVISPAEDSNSPYETLPVISVKPNFFNLEDIKYGIKKKLELKINNTGSGIIRGTIILPESLPALETNQKTFTGNQLVELEIDTNQLKPGESYKENIVIHSSGGSAYIPISFIVKERFSKNNSEEEDINSDKNKWKTRIVDIAPYKEDIIQKPQEETRKKYRYKAVIYSIVVIIALLTSLMIIKKIYIKYHEYLKEKDYIKLLKNARICFPAEKTDELNNDIFSVNIDGSDLKNLTESLSDNSFPAWSPGGDKIAFSTNRNGFYNIYIMDGDGKKTIRVTGGDIIDATCPSWSPDGGKIAFQCFHNDNYEIFAIKSDGSRMLNLTMNKSGDFAPAWSPDGEYIAFESKRDNSEDSPGIITREIYIMKSDGSYPVRITNNNLDDFSPAWSPDGKKLVFITSIENNYDIYTINIDGTELFKLTEGPARENYPVWTEDGKHIIYGSYRENLWDKVMGLDREWAVFIINSNGTDPAKLLNFGGKEMDIKNFP